MIVLQRPERQVELHWHVRFQHCTLGVHLEHRHVLSIEVLSFLGDPTQGQFALQSVGHFDLSL